MDRRNQWSEAMNTGQRTDVTPLQDGFGFNKCTRKFRCKNQPYTVNRKLCYTKHESGNSDSESISHEPIHKTGSSCSESNSHERINKTGNLCSESSPHESKHKTGNLCSESSYHESKHKTVNSCSESSSQELTSKCVVHPSNSASNSFNSIKSDTDVDIDEPDSIIPLKASYKRTRSQYSENNLRCEARVQNQLFFSNSFPPSRKRSKIYEDPGDLEIDTIIAQDVCDKYLPRPPNNLPMSYTDMIPSKQPLPRQHAIFEFFGLRPDKEPSEKSNIYIPHKYADEPQGDKLGVQIWTYIIKLKDGTIYHQHFFVGVDKDGPADKMKIRNNDEIVLVNGTFVPPITHTDLLNIFLKVKVDGKTRLEIIVRRTATASHGQEKEWEWIQTSAVLAPDMRKELDKFPVVEYLEYSSQVGDGEELKPCIKEYKASGTQYYLDIRNGTVGVEVKFGTQADRTKRICRRARVKVCPNDPTIVHYFAALSNEKRTKYISVGHGYEIQLDDKPLWFEFKKNSSEIWFKTNELFLSCNRSTAKLMADHKKFLFEETSPDEEGFDCVDGSTQMNTASSYFGSHSCCANTCTHGNQFTDVSGADVESTSCDMSELQSAEELNSLENESDANKHEQCPFKKPKCTGMTLNIHGNGDGTSSPHEILKTPTTPFASLLIAN